MFNAFRTMIGAAGAALLFAAPAGAQTVQGAGAAAAASARTADELSRHLRTLTQSPQDFRALVGAGDAALKLGDANAALGFFARAETLQPKDASVKAGLGRALLMMERPKEALKLFDDATDLGMDDALIAGDRGLAYDLRGDYRKAQRDYSLALTRGADDEVTRRYALSLGISGDKEKALALLNPLLYKRDQSAWRARAFVLALTGDKAGANGIVRSVMPAPQAAMMENYLTRLTALKATDKAMAVHLGHFPSDGKRSAPAASGDGMKRADTRVIASTGASGPWGVSTAAEPVSRAPRRRPGRVETAKPAEPSPTRLASVITPVRDQAAVGGANGVPASSEARQNVLAAIIADLDVTESANKPVELAAVTTKPSAKALPKPKKPIKAEPKAPARHWVQVAGGANRAALPREWKRLTAKSSELKAQSPWTVSANATNRLLAGPFETAKEARSFVNALAKAGLSAFAWSSAAGQEIEKLSLK